MFNEAEGDNSGLLRRIQELERRIEELDREGAASRDLEEAFRESELKYRTVFEHASDGISVFQRFPGSLQRRLLDCNESYARMAGRSREELLAMGDPRPVQKYDFTLEEYWKVQDLIERETPYEGSFSWVRPDGLKNYIEYRAVPARIGEHLYVYSIDRDVTKRVLAEQALRESEEVYRQVFESNQAIKLIIDPNDGSLVDANVAACRFYGYSRQEILQKTIVDLNTLTSDHVREEMNQAVSGERRRFLFRHRLSTAEVRDVEVYSGPVRIGGRTLLYSIIHDITERMTARAALQESERKYRLIAENQADVIWTMDEAYRLTYISPSVKRLLGYSPEEVHALGWEQLFTPDTLATFRERVKSIWSRIGLDEPDDTPDRCTVQQYCRDGRSIWSEIQTQPYHDESGRMLGFMGAIRDVTEQVRAEEKLRRSEETARVLLHSAPDAMLLLDEGLTILDLNAPAAVFLAVSREEAVGLGLDGFPMAGLRDRLEALARQAAESQEAVRSEEWVGDLCLLFRIVPILDYKGRVHRLACFIRDVTDDRRSEAKLMEYQNQLRKLALELAAAESRERRRLANELHDRVGQTLFLTGMKLEQLKGLLPKGEALDLFQEIFGYVHQVMEDSRSLLMEMSPPSLIMLGLDAALTELAEEFEEKHNVRIRHIAQTRPGRLHDDILDLMYRGARELLMNAIKHARPTSITITSAMDQGEVRVAVEDNGVGFDVEAALDIRSRRDRFGLFSLRERLMPLNGSLELDSYPGRGTRAEVVVPVGAADERTEDETQEGDPLDR